MLQDGILWNTVQGAIEYVTSGTHEQIQSDNPIQAGGKYWEGWSMCANGSLALGGQITFWICPIKDGEGPAILQQYYSNFDPAICGPGTLNWIPSSSPANNLSSPSTAYSFDESAITFSVDRSATTSAASSDKSSGSAHDSPSSTMATEPNVSPTDYSPELLESLPTGVSKPNGTGPTDFKNVPESCNSFCGVPFHISFNDPSTNEVLRELEDPYLV